jgi:aminoglycoside phosphotransferase (APT) family kinase protein
VDLGRLAGLLGVPHCYAGGDRWEELLRDQVIPRLPARWWTEAARRVDAALALPPVPASLVHGDLAGHNVHWSDDGRQCIGVLDWDLAQPYDPAVDVACLAWHGWDTVRAAVDADTYARARVWFRTFGLEQVSAALLLGDAPERYVDRAVAWLERTS